MKLNFTNSLVNSRVSSNIKFKKCYICKKTLMMDKYVPYFFKYKKRNHILSNVVNNKMTKQKKIDKYSSLRTLENKEYQ